MSSVVPVSLMFPMFTGVPIVSLVSNGVTGVYWCPVVISNDVTRVSVSQLCLTGFIVSVVSNVVSRVSVSQVSISLVSNSVLWFHCLNVVRFISLYLTGV